MKTRLTLTLLSLCLLLTFASVSSAQTPDGLPPALETVCDMEQGAAYGHCNAYCEAMDCELANDNDPGTEPHASATACAKVRNKFLQATGHDVPCEVTCPCADLGGFAAVLSGATPVTSCLTSLPGASGIFINPFLIFIDAVSGLENGQWFCGSINFVTGFSLPITPEQGQYCADLLEQAANSQNVTCQ
jgi:hypothetical protein